MKLDSKSGLIDSADFIPSPNYDDRDPQSCVEVIIIHCISLPPGEYGSGAISRFFSNKLDQEEHQNGFTDAQYQSLNKLVSELRNKYPTIKTNSLFAHSDIAPGRKPDPGPYFDWSRVNQSN